MPFEEALKKISYLEDSMGILEEEDGEMFLPEITDGLKTLRGFIEEIELKLDYPERLVRNASFFQIFLGSLG